MNRLPIVFVLLVSCADPQPPPPATPVNPPLTAAEDPNTAALAAMQAQQAAQVKASEDMQRQAAEAQQAAANARTAVVDAKAKRCADTREERVTHAKLMVAAHLQAEARLLKPSKAIRAACTLTAKHTGTFQVRPDGNGWRVAPELADDVSCSSLPAGLTKDDAYVVLWRIRETGDPAPTGPILERADQSPDDDTCRTLDVAVGVNFDALRWEDDASVKRLQAWKP